MSTRKPRADSNAIDHGLEPRVTEVFATAIPKENPQDIFRLLQVSYFPLLDLDSHNVV